MTANLKFAPLPEQPQPILRGFHDPHGVPLHRA
jgi:hypothetical protein